MEIVYLGRYYFNQFLFACERFPYKKLVYLPIAGCLGSAHGAYAFRKKQDRGEAADFVVLTQYTTASHPETGHENVASKANFESGWNKIARIAQKFPGYQYTKLFKPISWNRHGDEMRGGWRDAEDNSGETLNDGVSNEGLTTKPTKVSANDPAIKSKYLLLPFVDPVEGIRTPHSKSRSVSVLGRLMGGTADDGLNSSSDSSDIVKVVRPTKNPLINSHTPSNYLEVRVWRYEEDYRNYLQRTKDLFSSLISDEQICDPTVPVKSEFYKTVVNDAKIRIID